MTFEEIMEITGTISNIHILQIAECEAMYQALCDLPTGAVIVEVGCDVGRSSSLIFQMAKLKNFLTIHVDPWQWHPDRCAQWASNMSERCAYHPFILLKMTTEEADSHIGFLTPGGIDFAFIDGCHDQPVVEQDLQIVAERVKVGGLLSAHDYPSAGVSEAIDGFIARGGWEKERQAMGFGVWRRIG